MPTTNPVPSQDPSDLIFNAGKLDEVVSGSNAIYTDRLGVSRRTMAGVDAAADLVLGGLGYAPPVAYAAGIALTLTTQTVEYAGEVYAPKTSMLPFTTSGTFETAKFRMIQGVAATDLAASGGAAMVGYMPAGAGAVATNLQDALRSFAATADRYGADSTGATNSSSALNAALLVNKFVTLSPGGVYRFDDIIDIPSGRVLDISGTTITANTGDNPLFRVANAGSEITINAGGGYITGTCSAVLLLEGATNTPTSQAQYARQIRVNGLYATSESIGLFVDCQNAARQLYFDNCFAFTQSGFNFNGKCVEVFISNGMFFGSVGGDVGSGTYGLKTRSPGGTNKYNEGIHITNTGWDNFEWAFDIADVFVLTWAGGWISGPNEFAFRLFGRTGTNTHCREIDVTGVVFGKGIKFEDQATACDYHMVVDGCVFSGGRVSLGNNTYNVGLYSSRFESNGGVVGISVPNNCGNLTFDGLTFDSTHIGGVVINGASGAGIAVKNITYHGTGTPVYSARAVEVDGNPIQDNSGGAAHISAYAHAQGSFAVGAAIASVAASYPKGTKGFIVGQLSCTGMNAGTQLFTVSPATNMVIPNGSGWSGGYIYPSTDGGHVTVLIPFYCSGPVSGNVTITNAAGNTVTVNYHSYFGVVRDF